MNEWQIVGLISLVGSLVLVGSNLSGRGMTISKGVKLAGVWIGLFAIVTLFISLVADQ